MADINIQDNLKHIKTIRNLAPRPFGLYSATCIGLDGGLQAYMQKLPDQTSNFLEFTNGLNIYRDSKYLAKRSKFEVIKQEGRVRLLEFSKTGVPVLLIPSMINKYYIFDLYEDNSFIQYLIANGFRPFVLDWSTPDKTHPSINLKQSIDNYVLPFTKILNEYTNDKPHLMGYCMGGLLSLIATAKNQNLYKSLSLIASPYDFTKMPFTGMVKVNKNSILTLLETQDISEDLIQSMFYMQDCMGVINRIKHFANVTDEKHLERMVNLEDWLSDSVIIEKQIAKDIVNLWYCKNEIYHEELNIQDIKIPCNIITAQKDKVVPKESSLELLTIIPKVNLINVDSGHIGIMIGRKSQCQFFNNIVKALSQ